MRAEAVGRAAAARPTHAAGADGAGADRVVDDRGGDERAGNGRAGDDRGPFIALLILLVWLPLPLGSNRPLALALMQAAVASIGLWWLASAWARRDLGRRLAALRPAAPVLAGFGLWLGYGLLQLLPWPRGLVGWLAPTLLAAWDAVSATPPAWVPLTLDWHASLGLWMQGLTLFLLFLLLLLLVQGHRRLRTLAGVLLLAAVAQAMLASLAALSGADWWIVGGSPAAHGTYPNRNHLAAFLVMNLALGIGLLLADLDARPLRRSWRQRLRHLTRQLLGPTARLRIGLAILVVTLVLTASRMGNAAFFTSLAISGLLGLVLYGRGSRPVAVLLASLVLIDLLILGGWFGLERVRQRIAATVLVEEARYHLDVHAADYVRDYWQTGSGGGTFAAVFPGYRDPALVPYFYPHAENDYLEFLTEYGVIGLGLLAAIVVLAFSQALRCIARRRDPLARGMAFAALFGLTAMLIHSATDFNLRIPANAALFIVLLALPWIANGLANRPANRPGSDRRSAAFRAR